MDPSTTATLFYEALNRRDADAVTALVDEDIRITVPESSEVLPTATGRAAFLAWVAELWRRDPTVRLLVEVLNVDGETVVVEGTAGTPSADDGDSVPLRHWLTIRGGRVVAYRAQLEATTSLRHTQDGTTDPDRPPPRGPRMRPAT